MIIWLASYPKSGNTWVRSFLNSLLFTSDGDANLETIKNIYQFPVRSQFSNLIHDQDKIDNLKILSENWIPIQRKLNEDKKIRFVKTHHALCKVEGNPFTDVDNTHGVIYIVRDPRNVITSIKHHYSKSSYEDSLKFMLNENKILGRDLRNKQDTYLDQDIVTLTSSWKTNYNSWKNFKKNYLLIKYENLLENENREFKRIVDYLSTILNTSFEKEKIDKAINTNNFNSLQKIENTKGFEESVRDDKTGEKKSFFNLGPKNDWKKLVPEDIKEKIEFNFKNEMKELNYI